MSTVSNTVDMVTMRDPDDTKVKDREDGDDEDGSLPDRRQQHPAVLLQLAQLDHGWFRGTGRRRTSMARVAR